MGSELISLRRNQQVKPRRGVQQLSLGWKPQGAGGKTNALNEIKESLEANRIAGDEVISPIEPRLLAGGRWWTGSWPEQLRAGVLEPKKGYRFRPENVVLAQLLRDTIAKRVVDLGAGTGSLLLIATYFLRPERAVAIEYQEPVADRLRRSLAAHQVTNSEVILGDLRNESVLEGCRVALCGSADLVVMNPPFFPSGWGQPSSNEATRRSTHAEQGDVSDFLASAVRLLSRGGRVLAVYDATRLAELLIAAAGVGLKATGIVSIPDQRTGRSAPFRVWVTFRAAGGLKISELGGAEPRREPE